MKDFIKTNKLYLWIIIGVGFAVYSKMLFNGFVWDDRIYLQYLSQHPIGDLFFHFFKPVGFFYRPLTFVFLIPIYNIFGDHAFWFHLSQLIVHIANAILIFILLSLFIESRFSFLLALVFLVHPINVESVAYISAVSENMFVLFGLAALIWAIYSRLETNKDKVAVGVLLYCSLASKETGILFLLLLIIYSFINRQKYARIAFGVSVLALVPFVLGRIFVPIVFHFSQVPIVQANLIERLNTIPSIILFYFKTFIWPQNLAIDQNWTVIGRNFVNFYLPLLIDIAVITLLILFAWFVYSKYQKKFKILTFFYLWLVLGMGLISQLIPIDMTVSERWFYFPMIGLLGIIGIAAEIFINTKAKKRLFYIAIIILLMALSIRTFARTFNWKDEFTLYSHDEKISGNRSTTIETGLGYNYLARGDVDKALEHLEKSVSIAPNESNLFDMGIAYDLRNEKDKAQECYMDAVNNFIGSYTVQGFGSMLIGRQAYDAADEFLSKRLKDQPDNLTLVYLDSLALYKLGKKDEALTLMKIILDHYPTDDLIEAIYKAMSRGENIDDALKFTPILNQ